MTDETEHDKQYSSGCEFTDDYLDRNFELFNFTEDYYFIEKIGIRLSYDEALIYSQLPAFHQRVYEALHPWHEVRAALYHLSTASKKRATHREVNLKKIVSRWASYQLTVNREADLMRVKDVVMMAFPLMTSEAERIGFVFNNEVNRAIRTKLIKSDNLPAKDMLTNLTLSEAEKLKRLQEQRVREDSYQYAVVSLDELEGVAVKHLHSEVLIVLRIWREYLNTNQREREAQNLAEQQKINDIFQTQSTQIESPVEHHSDSTSTDNPVIPEAFKKKKFTGKLEKLILKAYISFLEKEGKKPNNCEELFLWMTNENMPDDVLFLDLAPTDKSERGKKGLWLIKRSCGKSEHDWNTFRNTCNSLLSF